MMPADKVDRMLVSGEIEIAPLAFMRGRTLSESYVIMMRRRIRRRCR